MRCIRGIDELGKGLVLLQRVAVGSNNMNAVKEM